jgi:hypothetical protein
MGTTPRQECRGACACPPLTGCPTPHGALPPRVCEARRRGSALSSSGALACNRHMATDEPVARCFSYATSTLASAIEVAALPQGPPATKVVIDATKYASSIAALLAHAGRVRGPAGQDAVTVASTTAWDAIRGDIPALAVATTALHASPSRLDDLRALSPLWPRGAPAWVMRSE